MTEPLFAHQAAHRLRRAGSLLPGDCLSILEARLTPPGGAVDLSLRVSDHAEARRLAHLSPAVAAWSEGKLPGVRGLWLEFDLDRDGSSLPSPILSARLAAGLDPETAVETVLPALQGKPLRPLQRELLLSCCRQIPSAGRLLYVFSLLGRRRDDVRLEVGFEAADRAASYVRSIAPAHAERFARIALLLRRAERLHVSFDVSEEIHPRFGLEGSFARQPAREPRWNELFDTLEARGLCGVEQRRALFAWPGSDSFWTASGAWPVAAVGAKGHLVRSLSHVKVVTEPDKEPQAKAYLALAYVGSSD